jgi:hypothetical protein
MANEAVLVDRIADPINFNCSELAMEKGTIVCLSGSRDVKATSADNDLVIGVLAREKIVGDGRTSVPVFTQGIFRCKAQGVITAGQEVTISGANIIKAYDTLDKEKGYVLGKALQGTTAHLADCEVLLNI